jgi:predicted TPR repeat methyltransferase
VQTGRLQEAKMHYIQALEQEPNDEQILFNLGVIEMQCGYPRAAIDYYLQALKTNPGSYAVHNNLGVVYLAIKDRKNALLHFREALHWQPQDAALQHTVQVLAGDQPLSATPPAYICALFDGYADRYDAHLTQSLHYQVPQLLWQMVKQVKADADHTHILDLGCGTGLCGELFKTAANAITGVDLSTNMLAKAAKKNIYQQLIQSDIVTFLTRQQAEQYDLIIVGDVLVYLGDLTHFFASVACRLKSHGLLVFNTEMSEQDNYQMTASGRFAHSKAYLDSLLAQQQLIILQYQTALMRTGTQGHFYVVQQQSLC